MSWGSCSCVPVGQLLLSPYLTARSFLISHFVLLSLIFFLLLVWSHIAHDPLLFRSLHHTVIFYTGTGTQPNTPWQRKLLAGFGTALLHCELMLENTVTLLSTVVRLIGVWFSGRVWLTATLLDLEWAQHAAMVKTLQTKVSCWLFFAVIIIQEHLSDCGFSLPFWVSSPLPTRIYCITDIDPDHRKLSQLEAVIRFLTGEEPDLECESQALKMTCWGFPVPTTGERRLWQTDLCQTEPLWHLLTQAGQNSSPD